MVDSAYSFVSVLIADEDINTSKPPPTSGKSIKQDFPEIYRKYDQPMKPAELKWKEVKHHPEQHVYQKYNFSVLNKRGKKPVTIRKFPNQNRSQWVEELNSTSGSINSVRKNEDVKQDQKRKRCTSQEVDANLSQN
ncbi:uncharacterized protein LOC130675842 [Microplitis mediator]|uniref:uncharacterized protein LOC130675842 n=1 Tax=Microplitis mediator TaxID=375433 RepID=UPI002554AE9C|nr:uncharacterized protein LOC130675842 [Microplitis mediator]